MMLEGDDAVAGAASAPLLAGSVSTTPLTGFASGGELVTGSDWQAAVRSETGTVQSKSIAGVSSLLGVGGSVFARVQNSLASLAQRVTRDR